ncbi:TPA: DNA cytosine methyltransferase, partial [Streptococcus suis]|nr:DNA cytosine methyltransferase [Streptococcus suis]
MPKVVDLFSGGGGMSLGFQMAGFDVVAAFENWDSAIECYRENFNHPIYKQD